MKVLNIENGGEDHTNGVFDLLIMTDRKVSQEQIEQIKALLTSAPQASSLESKEPEHDIVKTESELLSKCLNMLRYLYMNEYCGDHGPEVFELIRAK